MGKSTWFALTITLCAASSPGIALGDISAVKCLGAIKAKGGGPFEFFVTIYSDGTPTRIGTAIGVGGKAQTWFDKPTGATVVLEFNTDGIPDTLTTISQDLTFIHSRHLLAIPVGALVPQQITGKCERVAI